MVIVLLHGSPRRSTENKSRLALFFQIQTCRFRSITRKAGLLLTVVPPDPISLVKGTVMPAKIDHLTIMNTDRERADHHYGILLPLVGFREEKRGIWTDGEGFFLQFLTAPKDAHAYQRYGAGLNHLGFAMDSVSTVEKLRDDLIAAGIDAQPLQDLDGATALFLPDPDGLRAEFTYYPPGMPPVG